LSNLAFELLHLPGKPAGVVTCSPTFGEIYLARPELWSDTDFTRLETLEAFEAAFALLGSSACQHDGLEPGIEKIAVLPARMISRCMSPDNFPPVGGPARW